MLLRAVFIFFNSLYSVFPSFYKFVYFHYKSITERKQLEFLRRNLKRGMVVYDVGANIGFYTQQFSKLVGKQGHVYAFEPDPQNFSFLKKNLSGITNVTLLNKALGDKAGKIKLFKSASMNVDHQTYDSGENRKTVEIECTTLDLFSKGKKADFIKVDTQGFDPYVLKGAERTVRRSENLTIIGEFWPYGLIKAGVKPSHYLKLLKNLDLDVSFFDGNPDNIDRTCDKQFYCEFIAVKHVQK